MRRGRRARRAHELRPRRRSCESESTSGVMIICHRDVESLEVRAPQTVIIRVRQTFQLVKGKLDSGLSKTPNNNISTTGVFFQAKSLHCERRVDVQKLKPARMSVKPGEKPSSIFVCVFFILISSKRMHETTFLTRFIPDIVGGMVETGELREASQLLTITAS